MNETQTSRSNLLTALCILTFIGSGTSFIGFFLASVFFEKTSQLIIKYSNMHTIEAISPLYLTLFMVLSAISLVGAIRMWKLHRDGFFLFTVSQLVILFLPVIWLGWNSFSVTGTIFTGVFFVRYAMSWKGLR